MASIQLNPELVFSPELDLLKHFSEERLETRLNVREKLMIIIIDLRPPTLKPEIGQS